MSLCRLFYVLFLVGVSSVSPVVAAPNWPEAFGVVRKVCFDCHDDVTQEGEIDLSGFTSEKDAMENYRLWQKVQHAVVSGHMPPSEASQPSTEEREILLGWIDGALDRVALVNAGDPGFVTLRRLTNTEYDNTIRDLIGLDLLLSQRFAKDSGGGEGFTNTGDVLFISPEQLQKYLYAARQVAKRASVLPGSGIEFHQENVPLRGASTVSAQLHELVRTWYYDQLGPMLPDGFQQMRVEEYLHACWQHRHGHGELADIADHRKLDPVFLANWWEFLHTDRKNPILTSIRHPWHDLPGPDREVEVQQEIARISENLRTWMSELQWVNGTERKNPESSFYLCVSDLGNGNIGDYVRWTNLEVTIGRETKRPLFEYVEETVLDLKRQIDESEGNAANHKRAIGRLQGILTLRGTHPDGVDAPEDGFTVQAPSSVEIWLPEEVRKLRASAELIADYAHSTEGSVQTTVVSGEPPQVEGLIPGIRFRFHDKSEIDDNYSRDVKERSKIFPSSRAGLLDGTSYHLRRDDDPDAVYYLDYKQFAERLPENQRQIPAAIRTDLKLYYQAGRKLGQDEATRWNHLLQQHLADFATKAYRRPLTNSQRVALDNHFVEAFKDTDNREEAAREVLVRILVSPAFLYKTEPPRSAEDETPLDAWQLASRLSYFLWASMPDEQLREAAANGSLLEEDVLSHQVQRMMADPKSEALATEFAGQWLGYRDFSQEVEIDVQLFPAFDDQLRDSMQGEITRFVAELIRYDRPITDLLHADYTYLDDTLAKHYGIQRPQDSKSGFTRTQVEPPRGGILGMGATHASTAFPDRASPVRRGNWILKTLLGVETPPVPVDVPELENDGLEGEQSLRNRLEKHRASAACKGCHSRIDPPGFALQNFDAIGLWQEHDADGRPIDSTAVLPGGVTFIGPGGLKGYLAAERPAFIRQFCTKLLGYALGREVILSDRPLLEQMERELAANDDAVSSAVKTIVHSRQFKNRRNH